MDIRARNLGLAPLTDTGDPADCSWLTKAAALGAFDDCLATSEFPLEQYSRSQRIAVAIVGVLALSTLLYFFFRPF